MSKEIYTEFTAGDIVICCKDINFCDGSTHKENACYIVQEATLCYYNTPCNNINYMWAGNIEEVLIDANRYRKLRVKNWSERGMVVVEKSDSVKLGHMTLSHDRLDAALDAED